MKQKMNKPIYLLFKIIEALFLPYSFHNFTTYCKFGSTVFSGKMPPVSSIEINI